jgi:hypothetical protein
MNPTLVTVLSAAGLAGAAGAVVVYFLQVALRKRAMRLVTGAALFFTGIGLAEAALTLRVLPSGASLGGGVCVVALLIAVWFQAAAAMRTRVGDRRTEAVAAPAPRMAGEATSAAG